MPVVATINACRSSLWLEFGEHAHQSKFSNPSAPTRMRDFEAPLTRPASGLHETGEE